MLAFEDFTPGRSFALGPHEVTREAVLRFAARFDPQPMHLDDAAADASILKGLSASGWHSCAMMMRMMCDSFINRSTSQGSPGVDSVRWLRPVRPGDSLSGEAVVLEARASRSRPDLGICRLHNTLRTAEGADVLQAEYSVMLRRGGEAA